MLKKFLVPMCALVAAASAHGAIVISEVHPSGSGNSTYQADFFELTNTGASDVSISGWRMDDNSNGTAQVDLRGVSSIPAGKSIIFIEDDGTGANDNTLRTNFINAWFGGSAPAGFTMGFYGGSGVGLSTTSDAVNIFDSIANGNARITGVAFGASTTGVTFDNAAGLGSASLPLPTISTLSAAGVNSAFLSPGGETGSPGSVPEPSTVALVGCALFAMASRRRREPRPL